MRMLAVAALAAAGFAAAPGPAAPPSAAAFGGVGDCVQDDAWPVARQDFADQVVALVNAHRATLGLVPLKVSPTLNASAVWKARHMSNYRYLAHDDPAPPVDRSWFQRIRACGYPSVGGAGENIALGYETPEAVMDGWLTSPGHLANIENPSFRTIGVGVARATSQDGYLFWVQDFGTADDSNSTPPPPPPPPPPPVDGTAPTAPGLVTATASSATQVAVTWGPSTDDVGVTGYRVYRDGAEIAATSTLGYADQALAPETTYSYTVRAYDAAGNLGPASNAASVTTPPLPSAPPPPPPPPAAPTVYAGSYAIESGSVAAGYAAALRAQDGSTFDVAAAISGNASWYGRFNVQRSVTGLSVVYAGASTQPCSRTLAVWDWSTYAWQLLDTGDATTSTDVVVAVVPGPPARFLGGSSIAGVVRVRVTCSSADAAAFTLRTDRLTLSAG